MRTKVTTVIMMLAAWATTVPGQAQSIEWTPVPNLAVQVPTQLILQQEKLRGFVPSGRPLRTQTYGPLVLEVREVVPVRDANGNIQVTEPATVTVHYRNRLVAAASGYRLGGDFTYNGVLIESWDGSTDCLFTRWRLEFAGERLRLAATETVPIDNCES